jgi:DNA invertase Pin-like site-specific DNA recombinase
MKGAGADLYLDRQAMDTTTPAGKALFQMLRVFAEFERSTIQERIAAGIARARAGHQERQAHRQGKDRPSREEAIRAALASGKGILKVARQFGTGSSVVQRIKAEAAATV